ncbi:protein kinase domain-containing protein [Actinomyces oricola]
MRKLGSAYVLEERIGAGAQGEVWKGHAEGSEEPLAFKVLRQDLTAERSVVDAFLKERQSLERVDSPYVVRVRDVVAEGDTLGLVMDYVGGGDLAGLIRERGAHEPAGVAWLGTCIASGLEAIHTAGVVHRDIKPANVLIDASTTPGTPRVADFGVARICDATAATRSAIGAGTPLYMAPEVADGAAASPAMDVYSLGAVLYELSCGVPPFVGAPSYLLKAHAQMQPGRPEGIPDPLWALIAAMLEKNPAARPQISQVREALSAMVQSLGGLPAAPTLTDPPPATPLAAWASGGTIVAGTGGSPTAAVSAASGATGGFTPVGPAQADAANAPETGKKGKKKSRKGLVAVLVILLVVALAGGGFAVWHYLDRNEPATPPPVAGETTPPAAPTPSVTPTPSATPTPSTTPTATTSMPNLVGMTQAEAEKALPDSVKVTVVKQAAKNGEKTGTVISTDPAAGSALPSEVTLTVAAAMATIYLSDLKTASWRESNTGAATVNGQSMAHSTSYSFTYTQSAKDEWNLGRHFTELVGTLGMSDNSNDADATFTVDFYADQVLVHTETIAFGEFKDVSLDMTNVLRLKIVVTRTDRNRESKPSTLVLGDFALQGDPNEVPDISKLNNEN